MTAFDDYLGLAPQDFAGRKCVVFTGPSGAGKSSYLDWLTQNHPCFCSRPVFRINEGRPLRWPVLQAIAEDLVVVDELLRPRDLLRLAKLVRLGKTVLAASHLPVLTHKLVVSPRPLVGLAVFDLGRATIKMANALATKGYHFEQSDLERFAAQHGASYTALERILTEWPGAERDFGAALSHFNRYCTVRTVRETC